MDIVIKKIEVIRNPSPFLKNYISECISIDFEFKQIIIWI